MPRDARSGLDPDQARRIAEDCYDEVLAYCRRHAPAGHDAADLAQETFLRFVRAGSYRERGKPIAYLMRIARSVCVDASRARRLEGALSRHYDMRRGRADQRIVDDVAAAMLAEDARARRAEGSRLGTVAFVAAQVRFIPRWTWVAQAALVALMCAFAQRGAYPGATQLAIGLLSAASVLVGRPRSTRASCTVWTSWNTPAPTTRRA